MSQTDIIVVLNSEIECANGEKANVGPAERQCQDLSGYRTNGDLKRPKIRCSNRADDPIQSNSDSRLTDMVL